MPQRRVRIIAAAGVVLFVLILAPRALAQSQAAEEAEIPRTASGKPDLTGFFDYGTLTPLERPASLGDKAFLTPEEAAAFLEQRAGGGASEESDSASEDSDSASEDSDSASEGSASRAQPPDAAPAFPVIPNPEANSIGIDPQFLEFGDSTLETLQTSVVVDPPNGRIPPLTRPAQQMWEAQQLWVRPMRQRVAFGNPLRGVEDFGLSERCILGVSSGPPFTPSVENNYVQLFLTEDHFVIHTEMNHEARIVPLDGRSHLPDQMRQWLGDSRGYWDGDTLVVETTNFTDKVGSWNDTYRSFGSGLTAHLTERFTRISAESVLYEWTVNDPWTFTKPFSGSQPLKLTDKGTFEFHCHEGHGRIVNMALTGTRMQEREAQEAESKGR